jgi:hypothetical protein
MKEQRLYSAGGILSSSFDNMSAEKYSQPPHCEQQKADDEAAQNLRY